MLEQLAQAIRQENAILFVGAGVSASLGLPTWDDLIGKMADDLGYNREVFLTLGNHLTLGEFYRLQMNDRIGPLRSWMDVNWHSNEVDIASSRIHNLIIDLNFKLIYTTNYDRWLEKAHDAREVSYTRIANVNDIARIKKSDVQIVKFHGDFDDDASIVLTETDYFRRMGFSDPIDIKFQADALAKSILFIGYSASDPNIRLILFKLHEAWQKAGFETARPKSFIFFSQPNFVQEQVLAQWGVTALSEDAEDPAEALGIFLEKLKEAVLV